MLFVGHVDGMKKMDRQCFVSYLSESSKNLQAESTWSCATEDANHLIVKVTNLVPCSFHEIIIYTIFISMNAIQKFLLH